MPRKPNRRQFLQTTAATGIGFWIAGGAQAQQSKSPNERIAMASIGVGGKGGGDSTDAGKHGDMVAICDADGGTLDKAAKKFPQAKKYTDFRKMLEEMEKSIDAVTVSTPDHVHAPASLMAMRLGKHCFCQKPLTRTIYEARLMGKVAAEKKVATQMGNQGTADRNLRKAAALVRSGVLGAVKEVHVWTNRPIWPQGQDRPPGEDPVPDSLHWDLWIGPAPMRPYKDKYAEAPLSAGKRRTQVYHPFVWRGWWDFGSGALGDMACHDVNMPFMALDLRNAISVQAETSGHNRDSFPSWSIISYEFPANPWRPGLKMVWYDGGKLPPADLFDGDKPRGTSLIIGEKGKMSGGRLTGGLSEPEVNFPESPGHFEEWVRAIRGGEPAMSNFPYYAGPLAETVLLGNLAVWVAASGKGEKVEWDAVNMRCTNIPGLEPLIKPTYRPFYTLDA